jgi:transposase
MARSAALAQLKDLLITAPEPLRAQLSEYKTLRGTASRCRRLRPALRELDQPSQATRFALRSIARRIKILDEEIAALDRQLTQLVDSAAPRTTALLGISTGHAGQLLVSAGQNVERLPGEASFAALCGASPLPASSGKTTRHRLNYGGDRDANRALHLIAVCRLRYCPRTRAYAKRRAAEGKSKAEILRCLKRYIARQTYHTLRADLAGVRQQQRRPATTIYCGAGPSASPDPGLDIYRNVPIEPTRPFLGVGSEAAISSVTRSSSVARSSRMAALACASASMPRL